MELRRIIALICALVIPVLYIITIILSIIGNPHSQLFLAISLGTSFFLAPVMYLVTRFPKDIGEVFGHFANMVRDAEDTQSNHPKHR